MVLILLIALIIIKLFVIFDNSEGFRVGGFGRVDDYGYR